MSVVHPRTGTIHTLQISACSKLFLAQAIQKLKPEQTHRKTDRQTERHTEYDGQTDDLEHYLSLCLYGKNHKHAVNCESLHFLIVVRSQ